MELDAVRGGALLAAAWSKKPTPEIIAVPLSFRYELVGAPHAATTAARARLIFALAFRVAPRVQDALGNAAIMVPPGSLIGDHEVDVEVVLEPHLDDPADHTERRPLDASTAPRAEIAGSLARRNLRIVVAFGLRLSARPAGSASVFTDQRSVPHPTCLEPGAVVFAGARPTQAKATITRPREAAASAVPLEIRTICPL